MHKLPPCTILAPALFFASVAVGFGQTTWDNGANPDKNWSSLTNWSTDASPAGTAVIFGTAGATSSNTTVTNIVDASQSLTSLTYNGNSTTNWQVTQISSGQTLTVGGAFLVGGSTSGAYVTNAAFTGLGALSVDAPSAAFSVSNASNTSGGTGNSQARAVLDLSALTSFTANVNTFSVGTGNVGYGTVYLATTSTITTAGALTTGGSSSSYNTNISNKLFLGDTTTLNVGSLSLAGGRTFGTVKFRGGGDGAANNTAAVSPTLKIRAADGTSATGMTVGAWSGAFPGSGTSSVDLTGGTVDAKVTTLKVGTTSANNGANTASATLTIDGSASTFVTSGLVTVGETTTAGSSAGTLNGTLTVKGGATFTAGSNLILGNQGTSAVTTTNGTLAVSGTGTSVNVTGNLVMGNRASGAVNSTVNVSGGTLTVGGNLAEGTGTASSIASTVNLSGGTLDMTRGNVVVDTFNLTGGTLKNVASFTAGVSGGLNVQNAATLGFDNVDGAFTATTLTGTFTLGASANLNLSLAAGFTPIADFILVSNDGTLDSVSGTFATINGGTFGAGNTFTLTNDTGSYNFALSYVGGDGNDLVVALSAIPEPSSYAALFGALALGTVVCRRNRRS